MRSGERLSLGLGIRVILDSPSSWAASSGLERAMSGLQEGLGFTEAMRNSGLELPVEAWSMLEAGESTGRLGEAMVEIGQFLKMRSQRRREFVGQLWYPALVLFIGFLVMGLILLWVVPQMRGLSESMGQGEDLPWLTDHIGLLYGGVFLLGLVAVAGILSGGFLWRGSRLRWIQCATAGETIMRHMPLLGPMRRVRREARILRQLGTLVAGGVTLPQALATSMAMAPDLWERAQLETFRKRLLMGSGFEEGLDAFPLVGEESRPLLKVGQEGGQLDRYLLQLADDLDEEVTQRLSRCIRFLEPGMLLILSIAIGGLILAYLLPMVRMLEQLA
jgi:type II secretory pathway component PulF